jgi:hypothetical protein
MNEQSRRVLNLDRDPHAPCACALLVAPMCDPGPPTSPLSPTILFPRRTADERTTKEWWKTSNREERHGRAVACVPNLRGTPLHFERSI